MYGVRTCSGVPVVTTLMLFAAPQTYFLFCASHLDAVDRDFAFLLLDLHALRQRVHLPCVARRQ